MAISFRLAKAEQLADIRSLFISSMAHIGNCLGTGMPADAYSDLETFLVDRNLYVAEEDGVLLAAAAIREVNDGLYLDTLAVHKDHQNVGLGSRILAEVELIAESREFPYLRLHTPEIMPELLDYYGKHGFSETHRALPDHGRDKVLRVFFEKEIAHNGLHMDPVDEHDRHLV